MCKTISLSLSFILFLGSISVTASENWPQWRGPDQSGVAAEGEYPVELTDEERLVWRVDLPGVGSSTPAVWEDEIFVTCGIDGHDGIVCYDFEGQEKWRQQFGPERPGKHRHGSGSNPSPVTDGEHLVVYYKSGTLACLGLDGEIHWQINLQQEFGEDKLWWDLGTSPVLADGKAVVAVMNADQGYLVAVDLVSGEVAWRTDRTYETAVESDQAYTTPSVVEVGNQEIIVTAGADHLTAHEATTGQMLWEFAGLNPDNEGMWRMIASQVVGSNIAVVPFGRGEHLVAVKINDDGNGYEKLWEKRGIGADVPTPIYRDGKVIVLGDSGQLTCLEIESGEEVWSSELPRSRSRYYASPILAGDTLYCTREDGVVFTCKVTNDSLDIVAESDLGEQLIATPIPIREKLLVRGLEHLYLFE